MKGLLKTKVAVESKEDESVSAQKVKSKNEEDEEKWRRIC